MCNMAKPASSVGRTSAYRTKIDMGLSPTRGSSFFLTVLGGLYCAVLYSLCYFYVKCRFMKHFTLQVGGNID